MSIDTGQLQGQPILGVNGERIGTAESVYLDNQTGRPEWVEVKTGLFGTKSALVPLADAQPDLAGGFRLPYDKAKIKAAPHHDPDQQLSETEEAELFRYYDLPYSPPADPPPAAAGHAAIVGDDTADLRADSHLREADSHLREADSDLREADSDEAMTRSEERLQVGIQSVETGRARLRRYLVTEQVQQTVPVTHEEVRVEREPITEANRGAAYRGPDLSEAEHEVVLRAERPVVAKETVPVERVRLDTQAVTEPAQVNETIRKEQIDTDGVDDISGGVEERRARD